MSEPDNTPYSPNGTGGGGRAEPQAMPFFPAPPGGAPLPGPGPARGQSVSGSRPVIPLGAPVAGRHSTATDQPVPVTPPEVEVAGQLRVEDLVVEKIATLAALEVPGSVALGERGITVRTAGDQVSVDLTIVVAYGSVVLEVARQVQVNVARIVGVMLGMRVDTVDVTVTDVKLPDQAR